MAEQLIQSAKFKRNYVAGFAIFLFFSIVIGEIALAIAIPSYMRRESSLAYQVRKLNLLTNFDQTRRICQEIPSRSDLSLLEKKMLIDSLGELAAYLRKESDRLTSDEITQIQAAVNQIGKLAARARGKKDSKTGNFQNGYTFSQEIKLDTASYVNDLLKKTVPEAGKKNTPVSGGGKR